MRANAFIPLLTALTFLLLLPAAASADDIGLRSSQSGHTAPQDSPHAAATLPDWTALNWDILQLPSPNGALKTPAKSVPQKPGPEWSRNDHPDGSAAVTVNRRLPTVLESKVGVDMTLAPTATTTPQPFNPDRLIPGATAPDSSGAAWANITAPSLDLPLGWDKASFDARLDPLHEQRIFGTNVSKSIPLGERSSVTLQNAYSVTQSLAAPSAPATGTAPASQVYTTETSARLNLPTGTAFSLGRSITTTEERWLSNFKAEQKLFEGVSVTGAVSETATGEHHRSLTAGFKRNW